MKKIIIIIAGLILLLGAVFFFYIKSLNSSPMKISDGLKIFKIEKGSSAKKIILNLKQERIIKSSNYAYIYLRHKKLSLKAGTYSISPEMTTKEVLHLLTKGTQAVKKLTIPEGLSLKKVAKLFEDNGFATTEEFLSLVNNKEFLKETGIFADTAEGFLYPETYFFGEHDSLEMMLKMIIKTFFQKTAQIKGFPEDFNAAYEKIILASIIEREYQIAEEAPVIAGVFTNRLKINMGLQSCATVEYIITEIQNKKHPKRLFYEDLEIKNPYNTYLYAGLPPGPICNPGFTALYAACNPAKTDYFYFRLIDEKTGKHSFSKTIDEHNRAN